MWNAEFSFGVTAIWFLVICDLAFGGTATVLRGRCRQIPEWIAVRRWWNNPGLMTCYNKALERQLGAL